MSQNNHHMKQDPTTNETTISPIILSGELRSFPSLRTTTGTDHHIRNTLRQFRHPGEVLFLDPLSPRFAQQVEQRDLMPAPDETERNRQAPRQTRPLSEHEASAPLSAPALPSGHHMTQKKGRILTHLAISVVLLLIAALPLLLSVFSPGSANLLAASDQKTNHFLTVGHLLFTSSGQFDPTSKLGLSDQLTLDLRSIKPPASLKALWAWLLPEKGTTTVMPLLLGKLSPDPTGAVHVTYQTPDHRNLLTTFSRVLITEEPINNSPGTPSLNPQLWRYIGEISNIPAPGDEKRYSLLSHIRHLVAVDPTLEKISLSGGLSIWLYRNSQKLLEWASSARDDWGKQNPDLLRRQVMRLIEYLDGSAYAWHDLPAGTPWLVDPKAGRLGLLNVTNNQELAGYLVHISLHLSGLINAPGATTEQKNRAVKIDDVIHTLTSLLQQMRTDAIKLVRMTENELRQREALTLLNNLVSKANLAYVGQTDPGTGGSQGGVVWVHEQIQQLADIPITVA